MIGRKTDGFIEIDGIVSPTTFSHITQEMGEDGDILITNGKVFVTKDSPCLMALADPLGVDDGKDVAVHDTTGHPHQIAGSFGGGYTLATFSGSIMTATFAAFHGVWYASGEGLVLS